MKARKESPSTSTPPPAPSTAPAPTLAATAVVKKKKTVTWAPDGQLESIKIIERAVYEGDPVDVSIFFPLNCIIEIWSTKLTVS
jgi:protein phosphatase 1 regulatory subunit 10